MLVVSCGRHKNNWHGFDIMDARRLLGRNITRLAARDGYSKTGLANYLDVPTQHVSRWVAGMNFPTQYLDKIAEYFEVPIKELFNDDEVPSAETTHKRSPTPEEALRIVAENMGFDLRKAALKKKNKK